MPRSIGRGVHEQIAVDLLARDGIRVIWQLHLRAARAYRDGHAAVAEQLTETADAAERLIRRANDLPFGQPS
jgi:hypothetical protein